ncbi:MAG: hypothetical protein ACREMH_08860 [Gemmatimonadales bacterium]
MRTIVGVVAALVLAAAPAAAQEAAPASPAVTLQEAGQAIQGMGAVYAQLRQALDQRDAIYRDLATKLLAIPSPTRDTPRESLEAAIRDARAAAAQAQGEAAQLDGQIESLRTRFADLAAIAKSRHETAMNTIRNLK